MNPSQAGCFNVPVNDGVPCDDGNGCTQYEYCQAGAPRRHDRQRHALR
ncbi:MAG: hypothetical protein IPM79_39560 [Polyangiaceae bacterium]|nr:hypothetical protein [Polyangiaceae bacterium]